MNYGKFKSCLNIGCLIFCCACFFTIQGCIKEAKIVEYDELKSWFENNEYMVLIDVRSTANFNSGHLQNAINIDLSTFVNTDGTLINSGEALTTVVADKGKKIVVYCFGNGKDKIFADAALGLRYTNVYRYVGGTADWSEHGDYYVIEYAGFKTWYDAQYPFDNEENYLIDDRPVTWYTGDDYAHPDGHIPGALNMPLEFWVNSYGGLVNNGKASLVP